MSLLKSRPKPVVEFTGKLDQRCMDNKTTSGNKKFLKTAKKK